MSSFGGRARRKDGEQERKREFAKGKGKSSKGRTTLKGGKGELEEGAWQMYAQYVSRWTATQKLRWCSARFGGLSRGGAGQQPQGRANASSRQQS